ncbi:MAG: anhydro-N-acetylmuramic acid kinase [Nitrospirae bacterium]|nr:anhydro-N-acetylmuramic acid kinase [Nitrospirota bacterium]MBI3605272.1 anhydro-N-acetylmuramic acid kinase [Nitrospirota bacterium]
MKIIGLMAGTSLDGIDAALMEISRPAGSLRYKLLAFETTPFPKTMREKLLDVSGEGNETTPLISHLNFYLGELFAGASLKIASKAGCPIGKVDLIGSHGQTIWHSSRPIREGKLGIRSTFQIGELSVIAERTGVTTIGDFRPGDIAAGGEGAPLAPYFHRDIVKKRGKNRMIVNIGGISNVTFLPAVHTDKVLAFDTGPGNMLIDGLVQIMTEGKLKFDRDGKIGGSGKISLTLMEELMEHPFLSLRPPKSTGRDTFGADLIEFLLDQRKKLRISFEDLVATATSFTSTSIFTNCEKFILPHHRVDEIVVGGGGVRNKTLMRLLKKAFQPVPLFGFEDIGLNSKAIEAMAFALLAHDAFLGIPNNIPSVTGAKRPVVMGKIAPGLNYRKIVQKYLK